MELQMVIRRGDRDRRLHLQTVARLASSPFPLK